MYQELAKINDHNDEGWSIWNFPLKLSLEEMNKQDQKSIDAIRYALLP